MILAVVIALLVSLIAASEFGGTATAAKAAAYTPVATAGSHAGNAVMADTWLAKALPELVPALR